MAMFAGSPLIAPDSTPLNPLVRPHIRGATSRAGGTEACGWIERIAPAAPNYIAVFRSL